MTNSKLQTSFTVIEVIVVIVIIGIVSGIMFASRANLKGVRINQAANRIKTDIRYAQSYALSSQKNTRVSFNASANNYSILYEDSPGNWNMLKDPLTKEDLTVSFGSGNSVQVFIISSNFVAINYQLVFDLRGEPYGYNPLDASTIPLSSTGILALNDNISVEVGPITGMVKVVQ